MGKQKIFSQFFLILIFGLIFWAPLPAGAETLGSQSVFYVGSEYDYYGRNQINALLLYQSSKLNFYVDTNWWQSLTMNLQNNVNAQLFYLASYFENYDYPKIIAVFGSEAIPGIDGDPRIYVLFHPLKQNFLGYARFVDALPASATNFSNQHEMVYLSPEIVLNTPSAQIGYYLAHEVLHLISFNQKGIFVNAEDERWLAEARSDYLSTFLGYNNVYQGSILEKRLNSIRQNSNFSLLDFKGTASDYAAVHLLAEYIVEKYGLKILVDSLRSNLTGIASLNEALAKNGFGDNFNEIFKNWLIAMSFNDCSLGKFYCFENPNLIGFRIYPSTTYLPDYGASSLTASAYLNLYAGNWMKLSGGNGELKLTYEFPSGTQFFLPYVIIDQDNNKKIEVLSEKYGLKGVISVPDFGKSNIALYLMPFVVNNSTGATLFKWEVSIGSAYVGSSDLVEILTQKINQLKAQLALLIAQLNSLMNQQTGGICSRFQRDLYYGLTNSWEVRCLQQMLSQKEPDIYPESLITGNFLELTKAAVQKYQQKYGLPATGYFGPLSRALANQQWFGY